MAGTTAHSRAEVVPATGSTGRGRRTWTRIGLLGCLVTYAAVVLLRMVAIPPLLLADEPSHVDYGIQLTHGRIPVLGETYVPEFPMLRQAQNHDQHTSNHPPLYYALTGPLERLAQATGHATVFLESARLVGAVLTAGTVLAVGYLSWLLLSGASAGRRAFAAVASSATVAVLPPLLVPAAAIMNDPLEVLLAVLTLLVLVRATRVGLGNRTVVALAVLCTLGLLSRLSFAPVWVVAVAAVVVVTWRERGVADARAVARVAVVRAAALVVVPLAGAGWFYALTVSRYGDITGGRVVYNRPDVSSRALSPQAQHGTILYLLDPRTWWLQLKQVAGLVSTVGRDHESALHTALAGALAALLLIGAVATISRLTKNPWPLDRSGLWALVALVLVTAATGLELAQHVEQHGGENARYLLNGVALWGLGTAVLMLAMGRRLAPYALAVVLAIETVGCLDNAVATLRQRGGLSGSWFHTLVSGARATGVPAPEAVVIVLLAVTLGGLALVVAALVRLAGEIEARSEGNPDQSPGTK